MKENIYRYFTLENSLAAISATIFDSHTLATDGVNCKIYQINPEGDTICRFDTFRALRRIRQTDNSSIITALGCCSDKQIYFLDENLREFCSVLLKAPRICGCPIDDFSEVTDASLVKLGNDNFIVAASPKGAYLFDTNGRYLETLCTAECNEFLTDFILLQCGIYAMVTLRENRQILTFSDGNKTQSRILDNNLVLRMLIPQNGEIYGLFGSNYIYNRIIRIGFGNISPVCP